MQPSSVTFWNSLQAVAAIALVGVGLFFLYTIADILLIFLAAFIFAIALDKPLDGLVRRGVGRIPAVLVIYSLFLVVSVAVVTLTVPPLVQQIRNFTADISSRVETSDLDSFSLIDQELRALGDNPYLNSLTDIFQSSSQVVINTMLRVYSGFITFLIIFFLALFLNIQRDGVKQFITVLVPLQYQTYAISLFEKIQRQVSHWLWGKTISSLFVALMIFPGFLLLDIPYAVTFTILTFFFNYIPFAGPFLSAIPPTFLGLLISPFHAFAVVFLYVFVNTLETFVVIPMLLKQSIQLNPVLLLFAMLVGGRLGGALGILLSIPVVAILTLLYQEYQQVWYGRAKQSVATVNPEEDSLDPYKAPK